MFRLRTRLRWPDVTEHWHCTSAPNELTSRRLALLRPPQFEVTTSFDQIHSWRTKLRTYYHGMARTKPLSYWLAAPHTTVTSPPASTHQRTFDIVRLRVLAHQHEVSLQVVQAPVLVLLYPVADLLYVHRTLYHFVVIRQFFPSGKL